MGQQQLLLVILVTIIVGIATVVALNIFGSSAEQANEDAVRQDIATIAAQAQGWIIKPTVLGGGGGDFSDPAFDFNNISFGCREDVNQTTGERIIRTTADVCTNANGRYEVTARTADSFTLQADAPTAGLRFTTTVRRNVFDIGTPIAIPSASTD
ncbi:MAG: hypothetical protein LAT84_03045 [Balneolia bacterium]|nr:hypothetical protein [Balneolia bacterium]